MRDQIQKLVDEGFSSRKIAQILCWSQNKVARNLKKFDIKTKFTNRIKVIRKCETCNSLLFKKTQRKFCSLKCQAKLAWQNKIEKIKDNSTNIGIKTLKKYFIFELEKNICFECGQEPIWRGKKLVMQLDHIDGNSDNNELSNLRLLCPNCHTQTPTFSSKGKGSRYKKLTKRNSYLRKYKRD